MAVSAGVSHELPTLPQLLRAIAQAPGSCFKFYLSERKLVKFFKKTVKTAPRIKTRTCVLATQAERADIKGKYTELYITPRSFLLKFNASQRALCPGFPEEP